MSCGVLSLLGGVPGLLGGVLGAIVASDGDLGFFCNGVLGAGIADSTNDGLGFGSVPSALLIHVWLPYLWPFGPLCSMALCSCGFQVTSSMVGVGLGAGVVGDVGAFCRRRAGCGAAAGIICFHGFHVDG